MMGCRTDRIASFRNHTCTGYISADLFARQMSADTGFCPLANLDLNGSATFKIIDINTKPPACYLDDHIFLVGVERFVKSTFSRPHEGPDAADSFCDRRLGIQTDGTIAHVPDHNRCLDLEVGREFCYELYITVR